MNDETDKRAIDDPMLNQDSVFDKKSNEDFDSSDDFHKHDDTAEDADEKADKTRDRADVEKPQQDAGKFDEVGSSGRYDGTITI